MIKIVSGWSAEGGSTFSLMELCDLFNERGVDCTFYGPHDWHLDKCSSADKTENIRLSPDDTLLFHFMEMPQRPPCKRVVMSCHETSIFSIKSHNVQGADAIRFVSQFQKDWQGVDGTVIPNLVRGITKSKNAGGNIAGVVGTINPIKGVHESIQRALKDGCDKVYVYGNVSDHNYFNAKVSPLFSDKVIYKGMESDRQKIYDSISYVYQSNVSEVPESFGRVRAECIRAGIEYRGNDAATTQFDLWEEDQVFDAFTELLQL